MSGIQPINAKAGTPLKAPLTVEFVLMRDDVKLQGPTTCSNGDGNCWSLATTGKVITEKLSNANVLFASAQGGGTAGTTKNIGNGKYQTTYTTGPQPMVNIVEAGGTATINVPKVLYNPMVTGTVVPSFGAEPLGVLKPLAISEYSEASLVCSNGGCTLPMADVTLNAGQQAIFYAGEPPLAAGTEQKANYTVYGVDVTLTQSPQVVFLNERGYAYADTKLTYTILPPEYNAAIVDIGIYKDGAWTGYLIGAKTQGSDFVTIAAGSVLDFYSIYAAQAVLNRGSDVEIKGEQISLQVAKINKIEVYDKNNPCNKAPGKLNDMLILAVDQTEHADPQLHVDVESNVDAGEYILWKFVGNTATPESGNFTEPEPYMTLTPLAMDHTLYVGIDTDNNGILESSDAIVRSFQIKVIRNIDYIAKYNELNAGSTLTGQTPWINIAASLLDIFLGNSGAAPIKPDFSRTSTEDIVNNDAPGEYNLSHNAGVQFINGACAARVNKYIFPSDSEASKQIAGSDVITTAVLEEVKSWSPEIKNNYSLNPDRFDFPANDIKLYFVGGDLYYAIKKATGKNFRVTAYTVKQNNKICIPRIDFAGEVHDLYDFDYLTSGYLGGNLVKMAATLQFGWSSGLGSAGNVFRDVFEITSSFTTDYCFE